MFVRPEFSPEVSSEFTPKSEDLLVCFAGVIPNFALTIGKTCIQHDSVAILAQAFSQIDSAHHAASVNTLLFLRDERPRDD